MILKKVAIIVTFFIYKTYNNDMSKFIPLHIISGYSILQSDLTMKKIEKALKSFDYPAMGLTDENVMHGFPPFVHILKGMNKPYVLGMSFFIEGEDIVIFIKDEEGYKNAIALSIAHQKQELTFDFLKEHANGLIGVLETNHGLFLEKFSSLDTIDTSFTKYLFEISKIFKTFYLGIEVTNKEEVKYANKIRHFANQYGYDTVALPRIKYLNKEDAIALDILQAIQDGETLESKKRIGQECFMNESDYHKIYSEIEIDNTNKIVNSTAFDFTLNRGKILQFAGENSEIELKNHAFAGLNRLNLANDERYLKRLDYELSVINSMGYSDYFLIVEDFVNYAKTHDILVGQGRGSAAGSLVSYLLNITEVDPIQYDLQFERFLNPNRTTMPDIDVDFMDIKRNDVIEYMREKYGVSRVANIVAMQTFGAKQALRDIGRVYNIPERHITLLCKHLKLKDITLGQAYKNIPEFKQLCDSDTYFKDIVSLAGKLEGLPRQTSLHPSGVILNDSDISLSTPISLDFDGNLITQFEFGYLEEQGFLKMDFLAIRNLTTISYCVDLINKNRGLHLNKLAIPFDAPEIFELIQKGQVMGLFQINTPVMKKGIKTLKPQNFDDVIALIALNRPGPMAFLKNYALRRDGKEAITYLVDDLKDILSSTYGIIVYQEQVNSIATKIAGMPPAEADLFRRAISKKDEKILLDHKKRFIDGCLKNGHSKEISEQLFNLIARFSNYGFNKSHSVVYARLTCQMAYLKANYPLEFYSAILETGSSDEGKLYEYIAEMKSIGLKILPPDINHSSSVFDVHDNSLLFPLTAIKGVNINLVNQIIEERNKSLFSDFFDFVTRMFAYKINENQLKNLINAGVFDNLYPSRASLRLTGKSALQYAELNYREDGQMNIGISAICPPSMLKDEDNLVENLDLEYETLGVIVSNNPLNLYKDKIQENKILTISEAPKNSICRIVGIVRRNKIIKTKKGEQMAIVTLFDDSSSLEVTVFPKLYDEVKGYIVKNNILVITGRFDIRNDNDAFIADKLELLENI